MDLHGIVRGAITAVNPDEAVTLSSSSGFTTSASGKRTPTYVEAEVIAQVQSFTTKDLRQLEGLNLGGTSTKIYLSGFVNAVVRSRVKGGDLVRRADGEVWLVVAVLEQWPDWVAVACTLQGT